MNIPKEHKYKWAISHQIARHKGFVCHLYAVEVGAKGYIAESLYALPKDLSPPRSAIISKAASDVSYRIWSMESSSWNSIRAALCPKNLTSRSPVLVPDAYIPSSHITLLSLVPFLSGGPFGWIHHTPQLFLILSNQLSK